MAGLETVSAELVVASEVPVALGGRGELEEGQRPSTTAVLAVVTSAGHVTRPASVDRLTEVVRERVATYLVEKRSQLDIYALFGKHSKLTVTFPSVLKSSHSVSMFHTRILARLLGHVVSTGGESGESACRPVLNASSSSPGTNRASR